ncbi:MAG: mycofactocin system FadH/OYE family oxidoreductase 1 [Acidimicrobiales bacterium]
MKITQPLTIGGHELPSRVTFGSIATNLADGRAFSDRHTAFYRDRAAGGCGLLVTEDASVHHADWPYERCPVAEQAGPGWSAIADACREFGTVAVAGLSHAGGQSTSAFSQREIWAPSDEPDVNTREVPKIMEQADIDEVVAGFGRAAELAVGSGLAGVEINAGQFSLVRQFLSGLTNRRGDAYGQDRMLFAREVLAAVRQGVGNNGIVGLRLSCDEMAPWAGITPESAVELAVALAEHIDYLVVVRGAIFSVTETRPTAHHQPGFNLELARSIRAAINEQAERSIPIIAQGSIVSLDQADDAIDQGICDAVEMTRAQLADPDLVAKARRSEPPRPCVLCNQLCNVRDNRNPIISCIANPRCGHETTDVAEPAAPTPVSATPPDNAVAVTVIGAGPAGLEAARVAARRGLTVRLLERSEDAGGMAATAATAPAHSRLSDLIGWLTDDAERHGVDIRYGETVTAERLAELDGEVIVATGSIAAPVGYPTDSTVPMISAVDILRAAGSKDPEAIENALSGEEIAIWDPIGGPIGVAVAELVATLRPKVNLVTPDAIAGTMLSLTGDLAGSNVRLQQAGVTIVRRQRLVGIEDRSLDLVHTFTGETQRLPVDLLIDAAARHPDDQLWNESGRTAVRVGDAIAPRTVGEAIREGRAAAMSIVPRNGAVT